MNTPGDADVTSLLPIDFGRNAGKHVKFFTPWTATFLV